MPLYFIGFLAMLAATALLYVGALLTTAFTRRPLPVIVRGRVADGLRPSSNC